MRLESIISALSAAAMLSGCGPKTYEECVAEAANKPTDTGVKVALQDCYARFKKPDLDRNATPGR